MFCREGDENVRDASLSVSLGVEVPCGRGGRGWDVRAEESIGFGISDDSTVVDDRNSGVLDGCMPSAPRVKGKVSTHKDLSVGVQRFTIDECSHMRTAGWTWEEQKPGHGLCVLVRSDLSWFLTCLIILKNLFSSLRMVAQTVSPWLNLLWALSPACSKHKNS